MGNSGGRFATVRGDGCRELHELLLLSAGGMSTWPLELLTSARSEVLSSRGRSGRQNTRPAARCRMATFLQRASSRCGSRRRRALAHSALRHSGRIDDSSGGRRIASATRTRWCIAALVVVGFRARRVRCSDTGAAWRGANTAWRSGIFPSLPQTDFALGAGKLLT